MKKTKKGITLVELVLCCAILVMLSGACTAVLISGERLFSNSAASANTQLEANVLQTVLLDKIPATKRVEQVDLTAAQTTADGVSLYFNDAEAFTIRNDGKNTTINGVMNFTYSIIKAGDSSSATARAQFKYTAIMDDGSTFSGGMILGNVKYDDTSMSTLTGCDLKTNPLFLSPTDTP